jgi:hypothetical protein
MIGQLIEKQVDSVRPGKALLLRPPENSDPPGGQAAVSSADAEHHTAPGFCEGSCQRGRDDRDSEAGSDKLHGGLNIAYLERCGALKVMLRKHFIDKSSEGTVERQIYKGPRRVSRASRCCVRPVRGRMDRPPLEDPAHRE